MAETYLSGYFAAATARASTLTQKKLVVTLQMVRHRNFHKFTMDTGYGQKPTKAPQYCDYQQINKLVYLQIMYEREGTGSIQLRFLRLLSNGARQNFTYTCVSTKAEQR